MGRVLDSFSGRKEPLRRTVQTPSSLPYISMVGRSNKKQNNRKIPYLRLATQNMVPGPAALASYININILIIYY